MTNATIRSEESLKAERDATYAREHRNLAQRLNMLADQLDVFADAVDAWGKATPLTANMALGLISQADDLGRRGASIFESKLIGPNSRSHHGNEAGIALGVDRYGRAGSASIAYKLMYALTEQEKYGAREPNIVTSHTAVAAASVRVYAADCRVLAGIATDVADGKYRAIG